MHHQSFRWPINLLHLTVFLDFIIVLQLSSCPSLRHPLVTMSFMFITPVHSVIVFLFCFKLPTRSHNWKTVCKCIDIRFPYRAFHSCQSTHKHGMMWTVWIGLHVNFISVASYKVRIKYNLIRGLLNKP